MKFIYMCVCTNTQKNFWRVNSKLIIVITSKEGSGAGYCGKWRLLLCITEIFMRRIFLVLLV